MTQVAFAPICSDGFPVGMRGRSEYRGHVGVVGEFWVMRCDSQWSNFAEADTLQPVVVEYFGQFTDYLETQRPDRLAELGILMRRRAIRASVLDPGPIEFQKEVTAALAHSVDLERRLITVDPGQGSGRLIRALTDQAMAHLVTGANVKRIHHGPACTVLRMRIAEDPAASQRLKAFLRLYASQAEPTPEAVIRAEARQVDRPGRRSALPSEVVDAMVEFEYRFGGVWYRLVVGNPITYGLGRRPRAHLTEQGWAMAGIVDGDLTWGLDVLVDGRVAVDYGDDIKYRVLETSVRARLESHALLAEVRLWPHRCFEFVVPNETEPLVGSVALPPAVAEAGGPGVFWWYGDDLAYFAQLWSWIYDGMNRWNLWAFAVRASQVQDVRILPAFQAIKPTESAWCYLCGQEVSPGQVCVPRGHDVDTM